MDEHELRNGESFLNSVDLLFSDSPYDDRSGLKSINFHYEVLTVETMPDAVAFGKRVMESSAQGHLFCSAIQFGQCYEMLSRAIREYNSDSDGSDGIANEDGEGKKKAALEVNGAPLHYIREAGNMMISILSRKDHHDNICEQAMYF